MFERDRSSRASRRYATLLRTALDGILGTRTLRAHGIGETSPPPVSARDGPTGVATSVLVALETERRVGDRSDRPWTADQLVVSFVTGPGVSVRTEVALYDWEWRVDVLRQ
jgi:hypothetical protein